MKPNQKAGLAKTYANHTRISDVDIYIPVRTEDGLGANPLQTLNHSIQRQIFSSDNVRHCSFVDQEKTMMKALPLLRKFEHPRLDKDIRNFMSIMK